jgi:hypoxanthine-DNA glycosylase
MPDEPRVSPATKHSFPPLIEVSSRVLIVGTLPGDESLRQQQYYAHPRNQFWRILTEVYHVPFPETYADRKALVLQQRLALWDVVQHGERVDSLDNNIRNATPNNFQWLFTTYSNLRAIVFNGRKAHDLFERKVLKQRSLADPDHWHRLLLPSTSPAATLPLAEKIRQWSRILDL